MEKVCYIITIIIIISLSASTKELYTPQTSGSTCDTYYKFITYKLDARPDCFYVSLVILSAIILFAGLDLVESSTTLTSISRTIDLTQRRKESFLSFFFFYFIIVKQFLPSIFETIYCLKNVLCISAFELFKFILFFYCVIVLSIYSTV